jgi:hypothetical protein
MACSIENTNDYKMLFSPITGFNPGETSRTFLVTASLLSGGWATVDDLMGIGILVKYSDGSESTGLFGFAEDSTGGLETTVVPEPQTAALLLLGLSGLAVSSSRRA